MADIARMGMVFDDALAYLEVIALPGFKEFVEHHENAEGYRPGVYIRRFLVAAESLNNVLDYFYWQHEPTGKRARLNTFRENAAKAIGELAAISNIANAYKHAVRTDEKATIKQATLLIEHVPYVELWALRDNPEERRKRINQWIATARVAELMAGGAWWQAFADDPTGPLYQQLAGALPK